MRLRYLTIPLTLSVLLLGSSSFGAENHIPLKVLKVKDGLIKFVSKGTFPLPGGIPGGPGDGGVVCWLGGPTAWSFKGTIESIDGTWKGLGNPVGSKGWKFKPLLPDGCKIILKATVIKGICKGPLDPLWILPVPNSVAVEFTLGGDQYCGQADPGTFTKND